MGRGREEGEKERGRGKEIRGHGGRGDHGAQESWRLRIEQWKLEIQGSEGGGEEVQTRGFFAGLGRCWGRGVEDKKEKVRILEIKS